MNRIFQASQKKWRERALIDRFFNRWMLGVLFLLSFGRAEAFEIGELSLFEAYQYEDVAFYAEIYIYDMLDDEKASKFKISLPSKRVLKTIKQELPDYVDSFTFRFRQISKTEGYIIVTNNEYVDPNNMLLVIEVKSPSMSLIRSFSTIKPDQPSSQAPVEPATSEAVPNGIQMDIVERDDLENVSQAILAAYFRQEQFTVEQVMSAVRQINAHAFQTENGYNIKSQVRIYIPDQATISRIDAQSAAQEIEDYYRPSHPARTSGSRRSDSSRSSAEIGGRGRLRILNQETKNIRSQIALKKEALGVLARDSKSLEHELRSIKGSLQERQRLLEIETGRLQNLKRTVENQTWIGKVKYLSAKAIPIIRDNPFILLVLVLMLLLFLVGIRYIFFSRNNLTSFKKNDYRSDDPMMSPYGGSGMIPERIAMAEDCITQGDYQQAEMFLNEAMNSSDPVERSEAQRLLMELGRPV